MPWFKIEMEVDVTEACKERNDRSDMSDEEYIEAELGWAESSFSGVQVLKVEAVDE